MLPTFVSLFADGRVVAGSWFFGLLAATDFVDGYIARRFNQVSELGKILDPIADRLVFFVGITAAMYYNYLPVWFGVVILVREVSIALLMIGATAMGMERFPVTRLGKWATLLCLLRCLGLPWALPAGTGPSSPSWDGQRVFLESLSRISRFLIICLRYVRTWHQAEGRSEYRWGSESSSKPPLHQGPRVGANQWRHCASGHY